MGSGVIGSNLKASASPRCSPVSHQEQQHANLDVYVDVSNDSNASSTPRRNAERKNPNNTGSAVISRDAYDLLLRDDATVDYWRMIAGMLFSNELRVYCASNMAGFHRPCVYSWAIAEAVSDGITLL